MTDPVTAPAQVVPNVEAPPVSTEPVVSDVTQVVKEPADSTTATADAPGSEPEPNKRNRAQERIEDLVAERNAAKEYADYWRQKALEVITPPAKAVVPTKQVPETPPVLEDFKFDQTKWAKALAEWQNAKIDVEVDRKLVEREAAVVQQTAVQAFEAKVEKFRETHADWDILMQNPRLPQLDKTASSMVVASDHSAEITYALAKNPDLAVRISRMSPAQQALAIGRLENDVSKPTNVTPKTPVVEPAATKPPVAKVAVTEAPDPLETVPTGGITETTLETAADVRDWMQVRRDQLRQKRRR